MHLTNETNYFCDFIHIIQSVAFTVAKLACDVESAELPYIVLFENQLLQVEIPVRSFAFGSLDQNQIVLVMIEI